MNHYHHRDEQSHNPENPHMHEHNHHHHHHEFDPATGKRFVLAIAINLVYVASEFFLGYRWDSVGLIADAGHNLGDVGSLVVSLTAILLLKKRADMTFTYGFRKATVLAAFLNSVILLGAVVLIIRECVEKFIHGSTASGIAIMVTAAYATLCSI